MTARWEALAWDSEFFGFSIGRIHLDGADAASIARAEAEARAEGVECLYGLLDPIDPEWTYEVQHLGYRFVESAVTFGLRPDEPPVPKPPGITTRLGTAADVPDVAPMMDDLAPWSRFAVDPRFGLAAARRMQLAWVERAATCTTGEWSLHLAEDQTGIIAFITFARDPVAKIENVATSARGSGAARYLFEQARPLAGDRPLVVGDAAGRNVNVFRFVSHCGCRVTDVHYIYHRWLDEVVR